MWLTVVCWVSHCWHTIVWNLLLEQWGNRTHKPSAGSTIVHLPLSKVSQCLCLYCLWNTHIITNFPHTSKYSFFQHSHTPFSAEMFPLKFSHHRSPRTSRCYHIFISLFRLSLCGCFQHCLQSDPLSCYEWWGWLMGSGAGERKLESKKRISSYGFSWKSHQSACETHYTVQAHKHCLLVC